MLEAKPWALSSTPAYSILSTLRLSTSSNETALTQIAAREPLSDPSKDLERQEALKKLVFALATHGSVEFDDLLDKVLEHAPCVVSSSPSPPRPTSEIEGDSERAL
jgi:hypothetical protein